MKERIVRNENLEPTHIERTLLVKGTNGWNEVTTRASMDGYVARVTRPIEVRKRFSTVELVPWVPSAVDKGMEYPDYLSHQMWDNKGVRELD